MVRNCGHLVMHKSDGIDFSAVVHAAYQSAVCVSSHCAVSNDSKIEELEEFEKNFEGLFSVYSFTATRDLIRKYFLFLAEYCHARQGSVSGMTPMLFDVEGDVVQSLTNEKCRGLRPYKTVFEKFNTNPSAGKLVEIVTISADEKTLTTAGDSNRIDLQL